MEKPSWPTPRQPNAQLTQSHAMITLEANGHPFPLALLMAQ